MLLQFLHMQTWPANDTLDQQTAARCQTNKKLPEPSVNQRDHPNNNADPVHENLDITQQ